MKPNDKFRAEVKELKDELKVGSRLTAQLTDKCRGVENERDELKRKLDKVLSREASLCDYINTACREHGASEAERQEDTKSAFHGFWMRMMEKLEAAEKREKELREALEKIYNTPENVAPGENYSLKIRIIAKAALGEEEKG